MDAPALEETPRRLLNHLVGAVQRALRLANDASLLFDGSLEASVLAAVARDQSDVPIFLVTVIASQDGDAVRTRRIAKHLGLPLYERVLSTPERVRSHERLDALLLERVDSAADRLPFIYEACREARLHTQRILLAEGGRELFSSIEALKRYEAHRRPLEQKIADAFRLQFRYPYLDKGVVPYVGRLPPADARRALAALAVHYGIALAPE